MVLPLSKRMLCTCQALRSTGFPFLPGESRPQPGSGPLYDDAHRNMQVGTCRLEKHESHFTIKKPNEVLPNEYKFYETGLPRPLCFGRLVVAMRKGLERRNTAGEGQAILSATSYCSTCFEAYRISNISALPAAPGSL